MATKRTRLKRNRDYLQPPESVISRDVQVAAKQIEELQTKLDSESRDRSDGMQHMINLFTGDHDLGIETNRRYVSFDSKSSKPADVMFRVMGMLLAAIKAQYISPSIKPEDRKNADKIEAHINALYPTLFRRNMERWDVHSLFWQLLVGVGYLQQSYLPHYWDKNERRRRPEEARSKDDDADTISAKDENYNERVKAYRHFAGPPILVESIDPRTIWPIRSKSRGIYAWVKKYRVTRYEFCEAFRERDKKATFGENGIPAITQGAAGMEYAETADVSMIESVDYYEYIDDCMIYYVVSGKVVDSYEHGGSIKIFPAYGLQTGLPEPHLSSVGILWPVRNEIPQLDFNRTLWTNKAFLEVFPQLFAVLDGSDDPLKDTDGKDIEWNLEPGTVKQIRGNLINAMKDAMSGTDFRALIEMQTEEIDLATISNLARGNAGAQQPGYSINQLTQAMRTLWKVIIESRELQISAMLEHYLWMVANVIKESTAIYAESSTDPSTTRRIGTYIDLEPDDIDDHFRVEAKLEPDLPIDRQGTINLWWNLHKENGATWDEFVREGKGQTNPVGQLKQIRLEAMERETMGEAMKAGMELGRVRLEARILKSQGFPDLNPALSMDVQALKAARQVQQPAMVGPDGMPMPGAPMPGMPMPAGPTADVAVGPTADVGMPGASGPTPAFGANPADSAPGPRMGDMSSGNGLR